LKKLEIKLKHFEELEGIMDKERENLEHQRQQLLQERQQFHLEQLRAAEYRQRQLAAQNLLNEGKLKVPTPPPVQDMLAASVKIPMETLSSSVPSPIVQQQQSNIPMPQNEQQQQQSHTHLQDIQSNIMPSNLPVLTVASLPCTQTIAIDGNYPTVPMAQSRPVATPSPVPTQQLQLHQNAPEVQQQQDQLPDATTTIKPIAQSVAVQPSPSPIQTIPDQNAHLQEQQNPTQMMYNQQVTPGAYQNQPPMFQPHSMYNPQQQMYMTQPMQMQYQMNQQQQPIPTSNEAKNLTAPLSSVPTLEAMDVPVNNPVSSQAETCPAIGVVNQEAANTNTTVVTESASVIPAPAVEVATFSQASMDTS
jgi:hypothetical protein